MDASTKSVNVTRRNFLKTAGITAGVTGALAVLGTGVLGSTSSPLVSKASAAAAPQDGQWHFSYCRMCMRGDCGVQYKVANGVVVEVKGNPDAPTNKGTLCPRGLSLIQNLYNPYRVKAPLKRTNPKKGYDQDPGWVEISWDEALDTAAKRFKAVKDKDPRRNMINIGFGGMDIFCSILPYVAAAFGSPNMVTTNGPLCTVHYATELVQGAFPTAVSDVAYGNYHISLGRTIALNIAVANGDTRGLTDAIARGMKLVTVDPRCSPEASKGEWVPIRPGTDHSFVLGLIHTVLYEVKKYDTDFLTHRTNGPYLIGADGGYLRNAAGKPQMFDIKSKRIVPFDAANIEPLLEGEVETPNGKVKTGFTLMKEAMKQYTPEWAEKQSTVPAKTIRRIAGEFIENARIGETINLNGTVMPVRGSALTTYRGAGNHQDGTVMDLATKILNELVGNLDVPGGVLGCVVGPVLKPDEDGTVTPFFEAVGAPFTYPPQSLDLSSYFPYRHAMPFQAFASILEPQKFGVPYQLEAALLLGGNTANNCVQPGLMTKALTSLQFVASVAYNYDENVALSDIVLPDHSILEREDVRAYVGTFGALTQENMGLRMVMTRDPFPPIYNTRQGQEILMQMVIRMGAAGPMFGVMNKAGIALGEVRGMVMAKLPEELQLVPGQKYSWRDINDRGLKAYVGMDKGMDWFQKNGVWSEVTPKDKVYNYSYYPAGKTRYQIYFEGLRTSGEKLRKNLEANNVKLPDVDFKRQFAYFDPIPRWSETELMKEMRTGPKEFDLLSFNFKIAVSMLRLGGQDQLPWLMEAGEKLDPYYGTVCLNAKTAAAKGFKEGQMVWVESRYGKTKGRLHVSELFHPDSVGIGGAMGRQVTTLGKNVNERPHYNQLLAGPLNTIDPIAGGIENTVRVKVYAA